MLRRCGDCRTLKDENSSCRKNGRTKDSIRCTIYDSGKEVVEATEDLPDLNLKGEVKND